MNFDMHRIRAALGLAAKATAAMCLAVGLVPAATAQTGTAKDSAGTALCTFTGFTHDVATNTLTLAGCTKDNTGGGNNTGSFSWNSTTASTTPGGPYAIVRVNRTGNLAKSYNVSYTVSGGSTLAANWWFNGTQSGGTIPFGPNVPSVDLAFYPGSTAGTATITLTGATSTDSTAPAMTASGTVTVTVGTTPPPTTPGTGKITKAGCSTTADKGSEFTVTGQKYEVTLAPGETAAFAFQPRNDDTQFSTTETINTPDTADHLVTISKCPGDFTQAWPCAYAANFKGGNQSSAINAGAFWKCPVTTTEGKWYMNVKQVRQTDFNTNSCTLTAGCEMRVQIQGY